MARNRNVQIIFWVSENEKSMIEEKMAHRYLEKRPYRLICRNYVVKQDRRELSF